MAKIISRNFRILCDFMNVYQFMTDLYEKDWRNGVPAPFLEYALSSDWMDKSLVHRWKLWEENGRIVGLVFYENPVNDVYFSLRPGYEKLPDGFHFVDSKKLSVEKIVKCCWKGFDHEKEEGPWNGDAEHGYYSLMAPHMHPEDSIVIENDAGEYVCYAGMWWTPENHLAYLEPLCTIPEYRKKGLAAAALSEHYRRLKPLGATHMTGGGNAFYEKIGFKPMIHWTF